jgi:hypothetical protein
VFGLQPQHAISQVRLSHPSRLSFGSHLSIGHRRLFFSLSFAPAVHRVARINCGEAVASVAGFLAATAAPWRAQPWPGTKQALHRRWSSLDHRPLVARCASDHEIARGDAFEALRVAGRESKGSGQPGRSGPGLGTPGRSPHGSPFTARLDRDRDMDRDRDREHYILGIHSLRLI